MKRKMIAALIVFLFSLVGYTQQVQNQNYSLKFNSSIPLPNVLGRIDHMAYDSKRQYIYIAALGNNTVEVVDIKNNKVVCTIKGLREPQGVAYIPETNSIFVANGYNGDCDFFDADSYIKIKSVKLSGDADNVRYDSISKRIYVGYGEGGMAIFDAITLRLLNEVKLSGHPESFQIDKTANKIYVNIPFSNQIEIIDLEKNQVTDVWKLTQASSNFAMSLDEIHHRLFICCRRPAKLLVINTESGQTIASQDSGSDVDDIFYNKLSQQIYMTCGSGQIDVFQQIDSNTYKATEKIPTRSGARTSLFIPEFDKLIVASPSSLSARALLLIYNTR